MPRVLVVGGGYAGFSTAWRLEKLLRPGEAEVVLVDPRPSMTHPPFSAVRSTQFFESAPDITDSGIMVGRVHVTPALLQPIASADVVAHLAEVVTSASLGRTVGVAGPEPLGMDTLVRRLFATTHDPRPVVTDPEAPYFGAVRTDQMLVPAPGSGAWLAPTTYDAWLRRRG